MARKQSVGTCMFCGIEMAKGSLKRHLSICEKRHAANEVADMKMGEAQKLFHLQIQDSYQPEFWLHLEVNGEATLSDLDHYLRAIWLECCGHLSRFSVGGWSGEEMPLNRKIERVFLTGDVVTHIYDFGSSSITLIKRVQVRSGKPLARHPIFLLARNKMPEALCSICNEPATCYCVQCLIEEAEWFPLCDAHREEHSHTDYGDPMPLVNSPRVGICGYAGPAEPPY